MTISRDSRFGPVIEVPQMFAGERAALLRMLSSLSAGQWRQPTVCPGWSVYDVAAHILGDDLGRLARSRDWYVGLQPEAGESLPEFLNRINDEWVVAARRLGPRVLLTQLRHSGEQIDQFWREQDLHRMGEPVSWAGAGSAPVWLDAARDFTEYWTHRRQIASALDRLVDDAEEVLHTVVDTFARGLPYALRQRHPPEGTTVVVRVVGRGGGRWSVEFSEGRWAWTDHAATRTTTEVRLEFDTAWRLWTRGIEPEQARQSVRLNGDPALAEAVLHMVSIIR